MHEARVFAHLFGQFGQKSDDVMVGFPLNFVNAGNAGLVIRLVAPVPDGFGRFFRNNTKVSLGIAGMSFNFEPDTELVCGLPDIGHLGAAVARNHLRPRELQ